jgi:hypothetical protein
MPRTEGLLGAVNVRMVADLVKGETVIAPVLK